MYKGIFFMILCFKYLGYAALMWATSSNPFKLPKLTHVVQVK